MTTAGRAAPALGSRPNYRCRRWCGPRRGETGGEGGTIDIALATPETNRGFYRDIVVLAFPTPADDSYRLADISYKAGYRTIDRGRMPGRGVPPLPIDPEPAGPARTIDPTAIADISDRF